MKSKYNHIQVYSIWVVGRDIDNVDNHFPIVCNIDNVDFWHTDLKKAVKDFYKAKVKNLDGDEELYSDIFQDYQVTLFSIDIDIDKFQNMFDLDFDLDNHNVQDYIPYYVNYDFNVIAERVAKFSK